MNDDVLKQLNQVLIDRRATHTTQASYVASLHQQGLNKILEKVGEEATEVIIAAKDAQHSGNNGNVIYEMADLWFHSLVMLAELGEDYTAVLKELQRRFGWSGFEKKS